MQMATSIETDNGEMIVKRVSVPVGLEELMEGLTKEVISKKPKDICMFASEYFSNLLNLREKGRLKVVPGRRLQSVTKQFSSDNMMKKLKLKSNSVDTAKTLTRQKSVMTESPTKKTLITRKISLGSKDEKSTDKAKSYLDKRKARKNSKDESNKKMQNVAQKEKRTPRSSERSLSRSTEESVKTPRRSDVETKSQRSSSKNSEKSSGKKGNEGKNVNKVVGTAAVAQSISDMQKNGDESQKAGKVDSSIKSEKEITNPEELETNLENVGQDKSLEEKNVGCTMTTEGAKDNLVESEQKEVPADVEMLNSLESSTRESVTEKNKEEESLNLSNSLSVTQNKKDGQRLVEPVEIEHSQKIEDTNVSSELKIDKPNSVDEVDHKNTEKVGEKQEVSKQEETVEANSSENVENNNNTTDEKKEEITSTPNKEEKDTDSNNLLNKANQQKDKKQDHLNEHHTAISESIDESDKNIERKKDIVTVTNQIEKQDSINTNLLNEVDNKKIEILKDETSMKDKSEDVELKDNAKEIVSNLSDHSKSEIQSESSEQNTDSKDMVSSDFQQKDALERGSKQQTEDESKNLKESEELNKSDTNTEKISDQEKQKVELDTKDNNSEDTTISPLTTLSSENKSETETSKETEENKTDGMANIVEDNENKENINVNNNDDKNKHIEDLSKTLKVASVANSLSNDDKKESIKIKNVKTKSLSQEHLKTKEDNEKKVKRIKSVDLHKKSIKKTKSKEKLDIQNENHENDATNNVEDGKKRNKRSTKSDEKGSSFDSSKLHDELKSASDLGKAKHFKSSYNPYKLRQEVRQASKEKKNNDAPKMSKIVGEVAAAVKIQSAWRGFILRKKRKIAEKPKEEVKIAKLESNKDKNNDVPKMSEIAGEVAAAIKIQSAWRGFTTRKKNLNAKQPKEETALAGKASKKVKADDAPKMTKIAAEVAAAVKIQSAWRGFTSRKKNQKAKQPKKEVTISERASKKEKNDDPPKMSEIVGEVAAAIKIQSAWRSFVSRKNHVEKTKEDMEIVKESFESKKSLENDQQNEVGKAIDKNLKNKEETTVISKKVEQNEKNESTNNTEKNTTVEKNEEKLGDKKDLTIDNKKINNDKTTKSTTKTEEQVVTTLDKAEDKKFKPEEKTVNKVSSNDNIEKEKKSNAKPSTNEKSDSKVDQQKSIVDKNKDTKTKTDEVKTDSLTKTSAKTVNNDKNEISTTGEDDVKKQRTSSLNTEKKIDKKQTLEDSPATEKNINKEEKKSELKDKSTSGIIEKEIVKQAASTLTSEKSKSSDNKNGNQTSDKSEEKPEHIQNLKLDMLAAVLKIQSIWRGYKTRKHLTNERIFGATVKKEVKNKEPLEVVKTHTHQAVSKIQALWRGYRVRKNIKDVDARLAELQKPAECDELSSQRELSDEDIFKAATRIQAGVRGYMVRKRKHNICSLKSITEETGVEDKLSDEQVVKRIAELQDVPHHDVEIEKKVEAPETRVENKQTESGAKNSAIKDTKEDNKKTENEVKFIAAELNSSTENKLSELDTSAIIDDSISNNTVNKDAVDPHSLIHEELVYEDAPTRPVTSDTNVENKPERREKSGDKNGSQDKKAETLIKQSQNVNTESKKNKSEKTDKQTFEIKKKKDEKQSQDTNVDVTNKKNLENNNKTSNLLIEESANKEKEDKEKQLNEDSTNKQKENSVEKDSENKTEDKNLSKLQLVASRESSTSVDSIATVIFNDTDTQPVLVSQEECDEKLALSDDYHKDNEDKKLNNQEKLQKIDNDLIQKENKQDKNKKQSLVVDKEADKNDKVDNDLKSSKVKPAVEEIIKKESANVPEKSTNLNKDFSEAVTESETEENSTLEINNNSESVASSANVKRLNEEPIKQFEKNNKTGTDNKEKDPESNILNNSVDDSAKAEEIKSVDDLKADKTKLEKVETTDVEKAEKDKDVNKIPTSQETERNSTSEIKGNSESLTLSANVSRLNEELTKQSEKNNKSGVDNEEKESKILNKSVEDTAKAKDIESVDDSKPDKTNLKKVKTDVEKVKKDEDVNKITTSQLLSETTNNKLNLDALQKEIDNSNQQIKEIKTSSDIISKHPPSTNDKILTQHIQTEDQKDKTENSSEEKTSKNGETTKTTNIDDKKSFDNAPSDEATSVSTNTPTSQLLSDTTNNKLNLSALESEIETSSKRLQNMAKSSEDVSENLDSVEKDLSEETKTESSLPSENDDKKLKSPSGDEDKNAVYTDNNVLRIHIPLRELSEIKEEDADVKSSTESVEDLDEDSKMTDSGSVLPESEQNKKPEEVKSSMIKDKSVDKTADTEKEAKVSIDTNRKEDKKEVKNVPSEEKPRQRSPTTTINLVHSGEFHDTITVPISVTPPGTAPPPGLVSTGELHDSVPLSVQLNEASPAGAEVLTSLVSESISTDGQNRAQASNKDASTCETQPDNTPSSTASMETEKRNNATKAPKKTMEAEAATKIQAGFRGYQVRKQLKNKISSPEISNQRRSARRKSAGRLSESGRMLQNKPKKASDLEEKSAVKIQAGVRGFLVRRRQKKQKQKEES